MAFARLPKVAFVDETDRDAFGFLDPRTTSLRHGETFACWDGNLDDWEAFYVGIFVDRDMFMRYTHYGIGHPKVLQEMARDCANMDLADDLEPEEDRGCERDLRSSKSDDKRDRDDDDNEGVDQEDQDDDDDDNNNTIECDDDKQLGNDHPDDWEIGGAKDEDNYGSF
ncbi:uncharacterized protein BJ212DRAFT_1480844 [Suillus subaureus]|uniref:Uncharacterized protein n=1 Tax=Suillus subaureus TaxID=48587 RepID=A0A9P7EB87_9AGAM|nr:uncharacterized protein BJ212DRAFT_1480844 [Suillus subaureus]KAG1816391.1 hypothetical protein BJ212DRAFT_1480844 [Suillus subaureus]